MTTTSGQEESSVMRRGKMRGGEAKFVGPRWLDATACGPCVVEKKVVAAYCLGPLSRLTCGSRRDRRCVLARAVIEPAYTRVVIICGDVRL